MTETKAVCRVSTIVNIYHIVHIILFVMIITWHLYFITVRKMCAVIS